MNTNNKGTIGEVEIIRVLVNHGFEVFKPFSDHSVVDLIAMNIDGNLKRIQVKYVAFNQRDHGKIYIPVDSVVNGKRMPYDLSMFDAFAVYNPNLHKTFFFKMEEVKERNSYRLVETTSTSNRPNTLKVLDNSFTNPERIFQ